MLKIYNTLTRKKETFKPRFGKKVNMFVCGPTVYDYSHIGHARTYIVFDVVAKTLRELGYKLTYLQNITDIDDKIIDRANSENKTFRAIANKYEKTYRADMKALGVTAVDIYARATAFMPEIITQTERLMKRGYGYRAEDGIYFDIKKFKLYGKLSRRTVEHAEDAVSRIDASVQKKNRGDFCLWKFSRISPKKNSRSYTTDNKSKKRIPFQTIEGEPSWLSPWGWGRPGWHIEDTAISESFFGSQYDLHGGGIDLLFPHHECEIAQQEAASGKRPFVKYWMHTGHLKVRGEKMSKSLKNFITIKEILDRVPKEIFRLLILSAHWRSPMDYNEETLTHAKNNHARLSGFVNRLIIATNQKQLKKSTAQEKQKNPNLAKEISAFYGMLQDDFNTPRAIACLFNVIALTNPLLENNTLPINTAKDLRRFFEKADAILGIIGKSTNSALPMTIQSLVNQREELRKDYKWHAADELRRKIEKAGWLMEDTVTGPRLRKK